MRLSRIYLPDELTVGDTIELKGQAAHYLTRVLRLSVADAVTLFNGSGEDYLGEVQQIDRQRVLVNLTIMRNPGTESPLKITLVQAISRGERMDYTVQKAAELGVYSIQPLFTGRVTVRLDEKRQIKRLAHWRGVVTSACEQSGRAVVPQVLEPLTLTDWLACESDDQRLVLDPDAGIKLSDCKVAGDSVSVLVGPEGGLSPDEIEQMTANGVTGVSLGPRIFRTESAGPAAMAVLQVIAGDF
jgi:16S rRNA (uracil1498-N3)-methyltransferase